MSTNDNLFALDIGTRNVVGMVYQTVSGGIKIRSFSKKDHQVRCMFDGQIHDIPMAGDEITEKICKELLVDFNTAEKIKLSLNKSKNEIRYEDVLAANKTIKKGELMELIKEPINKITNSLADAIIEVNGSAPSAVFCIGGGSQLSTFDDRLAECLNLEKDRVTIKGEENWDKIKNLRKGLKGPQGVTPLGIALSSCKQKDFGYFYVTVNDKLVRLFGKEQVKVADALLAAGSKMKKLITTSGKGVKISLNGEESYFPGNTGEPATILVNGKNAGLETVVKNNDDIYIEEAKQGKARRLKAKELLYESQKSEYFYLNGDKINFPYEIKVNGNKVLPEKYIGDGSEVEIRAVI